MMSVCLSVAFFKTPEYTRFFVPDEAWRIKSAKAVVSIVFLLKNIMLIYVNPSDFSRSVAIYFSGIWLSIWSTPAL